MKITFDPAKNDTNISKHGVSLSQAERLNWDEALIWLDRRFEYNEMRMIAIAPQTNELFYVAFVDQDDLRRIISLRKATKKEVKYYVSNN